MTLGEILFLSGVVAAFGTFALTLATVCWLESRARRLLKSAHAEKIVGGAPNSAHFA